MPDTPSASVERIGPLTQTGRIETQPVLIESIEDGCPVHLEDEAHVHIPMGHIPASPLEQFDRIEGQTPQGLQLRKRLRTPLQVEAGPADRATDVDRVPR